MISTERPRRTPEDELRLFKFDEELEAEASHPQNVAPWHILYHRMR
jgi:hypothetical protein